MGTFNQQQSSKKHHEGLLFDCSHTWGSCKAWCTFHSFLSCNCCSPCCSSRSSPHPCSYSRCSPCCSNCGSPCTCSSCYCSPCRCPPCCCSPCCACPCLPCSCIPQACLSWI